MRDTVRNQIIACFQGRLKNNHTRVELESTRKFLFELAKKYEFQYADSLFEIFIGITTVDEILAEF